MRLGRTFCGFFSFSLDKPGSYDRIPGSAVYLEGARLDFWSCCRGHGLDMVFWGFASPRNRAQRPQNPGRIAQLAQTDGPMRPQGCEYVVRLSIPCVAGISKRHPKETSRRVYSTLLHGDRVWPRIWKAAGDTSRQLERLSDEHQSTHRE